MLKSLASHTGVGKQFVATHHRQLYLTFVQSLAVVLGALLLSACQSTCPPSADSDPKARWWNLEFFGPNYMTGWVEASLVEDVNAQTF